MCLETETIDEVVAEIGRIARALGLRIAAAESLTVGRIQSLLGSQSGSSGFFVGGITAYDLESKAACLGVERAHAAEVNCVSERVVHEMALGVERLFDADVTVATTGYAERDGMSAAGPMAYCGIRVLGVRSSKIVDCGERGRLEAQAHVADQALRFLRQELLEVRAT